jgi:hypothetical protein
MASATDVVIHESDQSCVSFRACNLAGFDGFPRIRAKEEKRKDIEEEANHGCLITLNTKVT